MAKESAEKRAYREIIRLILSQKYPPGSSLIEVQIADQLGMSRTPVRNALRQLVSEGLLENPTNRSCVIPVLSRRDLEKLNETRLLLEPKAAFAAAENADPKRHPEFLALLEKEKQGYYTGDYEIYNINKEIHFGIASMAQNPYLERCVKQIFWRSELYFFFFDTFYVGNSKGERLRDPEKSKGYKEHVALIDAIFSKDSKKSEQLMKEHILSTFRALTENASFRHVF